MIMPFLRLVLIYVAVAAIAVVFFNRDTVLPMVGWPWFGSESAEMVPADTPDPAPQAMESDDTPTEITDAAPLQATVANPVIELTTTEPTPTGSAPALPASDNKANPVADLDTLRNEARQAYWNGNIAKTETMYKAMAAANPENVDILGELGNLYFSQRRYDDAGTYYHMAAKQLISNGKKQKAMALINVLQSIAPAKAAELRNLAAAKP